MKDLQCALANQNSGWVRVIGDPILHQPGMLFPESYTDSEYLELNRQIGIAKDILIKTGGGGIAANQCVEIERPYQFAIVGVFYESEEHVSGVTRRYPSVHFPQAMIMINPVILGQSEKMQHFNHGCLSVPCPNRCMIQSPEEITVGYLDITRSMTSTTTTLTGKAAVALWHEMNHILDGKTYIDTALASLGEADLSAFELLVAEELKRRKPNLLTPEFTVPPFYCSIVVDEKNSSRLDKSVLSEVLPKMTLETLVGIDVRCKVLKEALSHTTPEPVLVEVPSLLIEKLRLRVTQLEQRLTKLEQTIAQMTPAESKNSSEQQSTDFKFF